MSYPVFHELSVEELVGFIVREDARVLTCVQAEDRLAWLRDATVEDMTTKGISEDRAIRLKAAVELGKRMATCPAKSPEQITGPANAARIFRSAIKWPEQEQIIVVYLGTRSYVVSVEVRTASRGNQQLDLPAAAPEEIGVRVKIYIVLWVVDKSQFDAFIWTDKDPAIEFANTLEFDFEEGDNISVFVYDLGDLDRNRTGELIYWRDDAPYIREEG